MSLTPNPLDQETEHPREKGAAALITVLWVGALAATLAIGFSLFTRTEIQANALHIRQTVAHHAVQAGVERALADLRIPLERSLIARNGTPYNFALGDIALSVQIDDESGKIDLNRAPDIAITGLFNVVFAEDRDLAALANRVLDWRDSDDNPRPNGAEWPAYRAEDALTVPRNGPFYSVNDLHEVLGFTPEIVARLQPFLTVLSGDRRVNVLTAPREVLLSFPDSSAGPVESVLEKRVLSSSFAPPPPLNLWTHQRYGPGYRIRVTVRLPDGLQHVEDTVVWVPEDQASREDIFILENYAPVAPGP